MVSFEMVVRNEFSDCVPQRIFPKDDHPLETTFFDRAYETFCIRIQIRRPRRKFNGLDTGVRQDAQELRRV